MNVGAVKEGKRKKKEKIGGVGGGGGEAKYSNRRRWRAASSSRSGPRDCVRLRANMPPTKFTGSFVRLLFICTRCSLAAQLLGARQLGLCLDRLQK